MIACARQLNPGSNVSYVRNGLSDLDAIPDAAVDLVYSFAVFQHLRKKQTLAFFREFVRLEAGGNGGLPYDSEKTGGRPRV